MTDIQPKQAHELPFDELPTRWEIELEFVQSLANTQYLIYLNQSGYLNDPCFLNYLNYLNYWKLPKYSKFLVYPNCLHILTLLQNEKFRLELNNLNFTNLLYNDMTELWKEPLFKDENELKKKEKVDSEQKNDKIEVNSVPDGGNSNSSVDVKSEVIPSQNASPSKPALNDVEMKDI